MFLVNWKSWQEGGQLAQWIELHSLLTGRRRLMGQTLCLDVTHAVAWRKNTLWARSCLPLIRDFSKWVGNLLYRGNYCATVRRFGVHCATVGSVRHCWNTCSSWRRGYCCKTVEQQWPRITAGINVMHNSYLMALAQQWREEHLCNVSVCYSKE
jgi:hypothetical protein